MFFQDAHSCIIGSEESELFNYGNIFFFSFQSQKKIYDIRVTDENMARMSNLVFKVMTGQDLTQDELSRNNLVDGERPDDCASIQCVTP